MCRLCRVSRWHDIVTFARHGGTHNEDTPILERLQRRIPPPGRHVHVLIIEPLAIRIVLPAHEHPERLASVLIIVRRGPDLISLGLNASP